MTIIDKHVLTQFYLNTYSTNIIIFEVSRSTTLPMSSVIEVHMFVRVWLVCFQLRSPETRIFAFPSSCPIGRGRFMFIFIHACRLCFAGWGGVAWANAFTFPLDAALHTSSDSLSHLVTCLMLCWTYSLLHFVVQFSSQRLFEGKIMAYQHSFHVLSTLAECVCDLDAPKLPWKKKAQGVKLIGGPTLFHFAWRFSEEGHFPSHTLHTLSSLDSAKPCSEDHATPFKSDTAHAKQRGRQVDLPSTLD